MIQQLPKYRSHQIVGAALIVSVNKHADGSALLHFDPESEVKPIHVYADFVQRERPVAGAYFVQHESGPQAIIPKKVFVEDFDILDADSVKKRAVRKDKPVTEDEVVEQESIPQAPEKKAKRPAVIVKGAFTEKPVAGKNVAKPAKRPAKKKPAKRKK